MANGFTYGINFPFKDSRRGDYLELTQLESQQVKSDLIHLLLTRKGERLGQPTFGTNLHTLLFEPNDEELEQKIYDTIDNSIRNWLPQLTIREINIEATDEMKDKNSINVSIVFTANYNRQDFNVEFTVNP